MAEMEKPLSDGNEFGGSVSDKGSRNAVKHGDRISALSSCKQRSREMYQYIKSLKDEKRLKIQAELGACANWLVFNNYYTVEQVRLAKARTCKRHLLCPFCARARGAKLLEKNLPKFDEAISANPHAIPAILTLTVKNGDDLQERHEHLKKAFKTLCERRRDWLKKGRGKTQFRKILGALFSTEVTYDKKTGWHPHIHAVVLLDSFIDQKALAEEWHEVTGDSFIVGITKLKGSPVDAMQEVFKYATKFQELPYEQNLHLYDTLKGKRLIGSFGCFHGLKLPESLLDELIEDLPYIEQTYRFNRQKRSYELTEAKHHEEDPRRLDSGIELNCTYVQVTSNRGNTGQDTRERSSQLSSPRGSEGSNGCTGESQVTVLQPAVFEVPY